MAFKEAERKIVYTITGLAIGGAETQLVNVATRLKQKGWDVYVVSLTPWLAYAELLRQKGITVAHLNIRNKLPVPRPAFQLARLIRQWDPSIVHSYMVHANLVTRVTRLFVRMPVLVCSVRSVYEGGRHREVLYRLTDPLCDLTTHVCREGAQRYIRIGAVPAQKMLVVPNGVDTDRFRPDVDTRVRMRQELGLSGHFVWLAVGRLEAPKDYPTLLKAFAQLQRKYPQNLLLIAGEGPLREELTSLARDLSISDHVRLLGIRQDVPQLMNAADAFVLSSAWEGLPNVLLEAHATALPIVATDVGGNREIVKNSVSGFVVPAQNPAELAQAMSVMMQQPVDKIRQMGEAGRQHILAHFGLDAVVQRWEQLYQELLARKGITIAESRR